MTVCGAANFHPAKPTAGSAGTPVLRRVAYVIADIGRDRKARAANPHAKIEGPQILSNLRATSDVEPISRIL